MLDSLPPEVLLSIAQQVRQPKEAWKYLKLELEEQVKGEQGTLLALSTVSKTLHHAIKNEAYRSMTIRDVVAMLKDLDVSEPFNRIEHLQLCHGPQKAEPSYARILERDFWLYLGYQGGSPLSVIQGQASAVIEEDGMIITASNKLRDLVTRHANVLPNLRSVTLGGVGGTGWNRAETSTLARCSAYQPHERLVPHLLIDLPSVETVCQYYRGGPLSLLEGYIQPATPVRLFTFHPRAFPDYRALMRGFPVIIGAVNRYYCGSIIAVPSPELVEGDEIKLKYLTPLLNMLHPGKSDVYSTTQAASTSQPSKPLKLEDVDVSQTVIEFYNYVRVAKHVTNKSTDIMCVIDAVAQVDPHSLSEWQAVLDKHLHPSWRGKVFLKHREQAPPCESCGLSPEDEHVHQVDISHCRQPAAAL